MQDTICIKQTINERFRNGTMFYFTQKKKMVPTMNGFDESHELKIRRVGRNLVNHFLMAELKSWDPNRF